jgi:hypothetical protein
MSAHNTLVELHNAPFEVVDPGTGAAISITRWNQHIPLTIGGTAETNTLAAPTKAGQRVSIIAATVGAGTRAITVASAVNQTGNTILTFAQQFDAIALESFPVGSGVYRWRVAYNDGVALS